MTDYTQSPGIAVSKPQHKRSEKLTQKQMGAITQKVRDTVQERSGGICEVCIKCVGALATDMAHLVGRAVITRRTSSFDLKHACRACHSHLDTTGEGVRHKKSLREGA